MTKPNPIQDCKIVRRWHDADYIYTAQLYRTHTDEPVLRISRGYILPPHKTVAIFQLLPEIQYTVMAQYMLPFPPAQELTTYVDLLVESRELYTQLLAVKLPSEQQ